MQIYLRISGFYRILYIDMNKIKQTIMILALVIGIVSLFVTPVALADDCGTYSTSILPCESGGETGIFGILFLVLNILTAGVGIAAVGGIVYSSILYTSAGANADQVKKSRGVIKNVVIGLVAYAFMYSLLNYIIPGGIFS